MSKTLLRASAMPFAHLLGGGARAAKADAEPDKDEKDKDAKKAKAEGDKDNPEAEEPEDDAGEGAGGETPDVEDVVDPDDSLDEDAAPEEDDVDPKVKKAAKSGRKAERSRWSKVLGHSSAAGRVATACHLLSTTAMSSRQIVGALQTMPKEAAAPAGRGGLRDRMASEPPPHIGADRRAPEGGDFGASVAAAMAKVRPSGRR